MTLFSLRKECGAVLKLDTGDMLPLPGVGHLLTHPAITDLHALSTKPIVWATQALGQPDGKINGGLMLFGRYWLHEATQRALEARARRESREQALFDGFFSRHFQMLPNRYNVDFRGSHSPRLLATAVSAKSPH